MNLFYLSYQALSEEINFFYVFHLGGGLQNVNIYPSLVELR